MSTPRIITETLIAQIITSEGTLIYRGMALQSTSDASKKGVIFELYDRPDPIIHTYWSDGTNKKLNVQDFLKECIVTGLLV